MKVEFIKFLMSAGALKFGDFTLKSGRKSPYFINMAAFNTGEQISALGEFYAKCLVENGVSPELLVGAAYKGIPLCVTTAAALADNHGINTCWSFDRKEIKTHGDGGMWCGANPSQHNSGVVIIDDVITAGTAIGEVMGKLKDSGVGRVDAVLLAVDRQEVGKDGKLSAVQEVEQNYGVRVLTIISFDDIVNAIESGDVYANGYLDTLYEYREKYGAK